MITTNITIHDRHTMDLFHWKMFIGLLCILLWCKAELNVEERQHQQLFLLQKAVEDNKRNFQENVVLGKEPSPQAPLKEKERMAEYSSITLRHHNGKSPVSLHREELDFADNSGDSATPEEYGQWLNLGGKMFKADGQYNEEDMSLSSPGKTGQAKVEQTKSNNESENLVPLNSWVEETFVYEDKEQNDNNNIEIYATNDAMNLSKVKIGTRKDFLKNFVRKRKFFYERQGKTWDQKRLQNIRIDTSAKGKKGRYVSIPRKFGHGSSNDVTSGDKATNHPGVLYTKWSRWSKCSRHCQQIRRRRCRIQDLCGAAVIKEKRPCVGWQCQHKKFHLIKPEEISGSYNSIKDKNRQFSNADVRSLLNYNSMFYTRWSEWAPCSGTCLSSRFRSCRYSLFCGNAVIREEGYCYTPKSACEKWYRRHKEGSPYENVDRSYSSYHNSSRNLHKEEQVPFNNKFIKENVLPDQNAQILPFQIGVSTHKFNSMKPVTIQDNNVLSQDHSFEYDKNYNNWIDKNNYNKFHSGRKMSGFLAYNKQQSFKKPSDANNAPNKQKEPHKYPNVSVNWRSSKQRTLSSFYVGRPNSLQKECGISLIRKPPWTLKILGGREAFPGQWPWQVAVLNRFKELFCGGTLITSQWVVTAAHCIRKRLYVRLAEHDLVMKEGTELEFKITETVLHPLYDLTTVDNDVALLRLPIPVEAGSKINPVCLPEQGMPLPYGQECTIIGWGKERNTPSFGTDVLNEAEVPIINEETCRKVYNDYYITKNMFCAGYQKGRIDSCAGDSGGPLLCSINGLWYIYGITSFGEGCGRKGKFGIYTKVSNYRTWISDVIRAHAHRDQAADRPKRQKYKLRHNRRHLKFGKLTEKNIR